ncbi:hypothetical protein SIN39_003465 [Yersinia enterocolitica]|nr:hypothetical protein [Yersinia enterocolitica]
MLNLDYLLNSAPAMPAVSGEWLSVYLEPMIGSGERFTIIVAAISSDGEVVVKPAIRKEVIEVMYGFKSSTFDSMISMIASSLKNHLEISGTFIGWNPPVGGVSVGSVRRAASSSIIGVLRQAVSLTSSLSSLADIANEDKSKTKKTREKDRWVEQLTEAVVALDRHREVYFNRQFSFNDGYRPAKIFYLSEWAAINTGKLLQSNLNQQVIDNKAKIADLSMVKLHSEIFERTTHELLVYRPMESDPSYTDKTMGSINSAFLTLKELADTNRIIITPVYSVDEAAKRILRTAA